MDDERSQILRFLVTGVVNTAFGYGVFALFVNLGVPLRANLAITTVLGVLFNYVTSGGYVFRESPSATTLARYVASYAAVWAITSQIAAVVADLGPSTFVASLFAQGTLGLPSRKWDEFLAGLSILPLSVPLTYVLLRFWVFRPKTRASSHE